MLVRAVSSRVFMFVHVRIPLVFMCMNVYAHDYVFCPCEGARDCAYAGAHVNAHVCVHVFPSQ